jgi:hypothetical protein
MAAPELKYSSGNSASTTISSSMSNSATSAVLTSDTNFAAKSGAGMVIIDEGESTEELAYSDSKASSTLSIPLANRGLEGGSAQSHDSNATIKGILTAGMWNDMIDALTNVCLATTGALDTTKVVDLTTAQTLTNKNLTSATNTFPTSIATLTGTQTLTNKRITQRLVTTTDDATAAIDTDSYDEYELSAIANATVFTLTGTPTDGQKLIVRFKDAGVSKALTWTGFTAIGVTLPTATTAGKWHYVGCKYNSAASAWHAIAVTEEA